MRASSASATAMSPCARACSRATVNALHTLKGDALLLTRVSRAAISSIEALLWTNDGVGLTRVAMGCNARSSDSSAAPVAATAGASVCAAIDCGT